MAYRETNRGEYIQGNVVRTAAPERAPYSEPREKQRTQEQIRADRARKSAANRNVQREMAMNRGYVLFLSAAVAICFALCGTLVHVRSDITERLTTIAEMEEQVEIAKEANETTENHIETLMSLEQVKSRATRLGMTYPTSEQIIYYTIDSNDYMNQYAQID